jgi:mRNA degradation ribonuclease J1/J2
MASSGVFERDKFEWFEEAARAKVEARIEELARAGTASRASIVEETKRTLEKYYSKHLSSRPLVTVEVVEIEE